MAEKTLKTRIVNKHASLAEWQDSPLILKEGEIALAKITTAVKDDKGNILYVPRYLMKVGEGGNKTFKDLQWLAAPASDVYAWAKNEKLAYADMPDEVKNISGNASAAITAAIAALEYKDAEVANQFVTAVVQANGVIKVTRRALDTDDIPSLNADKITAGTFADARIANASKWNAAATQTETNKSNLAAEVTAREATDQRVTTLENTIKGLSGAMHFVGESTTDPTGKDGATVGDQTTFSKGDVCLYKDTFKEYVYDGTKWIELGDEGSYLLKDTAISTYETIANCDAIRTNVTTLQSDVSKLKTSVGDSTSGLVQDVAALKTLTSTHTTNIAANTKAVDDLAKGQVATNKSNISTLQSDLEALTTEVGNKALASDLTSATNRITALETSVGKDDNAGLRKSVKELQGTVGDADSGLVKAVTDLKSGKAEASALQALDEKVKTGTFISTADKFVTYNGDELILDCGGAV